MHIPIASLFRFDLRRLILSLAVLSTLVMLANSLYASYRVQRQMLIDNTLEANRAYASKLAGSVAEFLGAAQQQLAYSAKLLGGRYDDAALLDTEAHRLRLQSNSFNSVVFVDAAGWVLATSPETLQIRDQKLESPGALEALRERRPLVSSPYVSAAGNLLVFISQPVTDAAGRYLGYIGGTIYLKQASPLSRLIGEHYHRDGSYLYVVDAKRRLLYHPQEERVGTLVGENSVIDAVIRGETGEMSLRNSQGVEMLAGYASVAPVGWGIIAQRPLQATLAKLNDLMFGVLCNVLPLAILTMLCIWWCARLISRPLWQLADGARQMDRPGTAERIENVRSWYFESSELRRAILVGISLLQGTIGRLRHDVQTDPLTGLHNRRGLDMAIDLWTSQLRPFAVVALDIDHFKNVNDSYGHDVGDKVLQRLARLMAEGSRGEDVLCRVGGEEFLMLLPNTSLEAAERVAERLRRRVEQAPMAPAGHITVSLGVAHWSPHGTAVGAVLKSADEMLYKAKQGGRNQVVVARGVGSVTDTPA